MNRRQRLIVRLMFAADRALTAGWRHDYAARDRARRWAAMWRRALGWEIKKAAAYERDGR